MTRPKRNWAVFLWLFALGLVLLGTRIMPQTGATGPVMDGEIVGLDVISLREGRPEAWGLGALLRVSLPDGRTIEARGPVERLGPQTQTTADADALLRPRLADRLQRLGLTPGGTARVAFEPEKGADGVTRGVWRAIDRPSLAAWAPAIGVWSLAALLSLLGVALRARPTPPPAPVPPSR